MAIHAVNPRHRSKKILFGAFKEICWLCQCYLEIFCQIKEVRILVSGYKGKIHAGWDIPPDAPDELERHMRQLVHNGLMLVRREIMEQREDPCQQIYWDFGNFSSARRVLHDLRKELSPACTQPKI